MSKKARKLSLLLAAIFVMMIMAVPAFATVYHTDSDTAAYYTQDDNDSSYYTSTAITVTLDIQSKRNGTASTDTSYSKELDITLTPSSSTRYTVADLLIAANNMTGESIHFQNYDGNDLDYGSSGSLPSYCYKAVLDGVTYAPTGLYDKNGWMFRINGKFPLHSGIPGSTAYGEAINTAYVKDGDVVTFYMDNPGDLFKLAYFSRIKEATYSSGVLTVTPQVSYNFYYGNANTWYIQNFYTSSDITCEVYSSITATTPLASAVTGSNGKANLSVTLTSGNTYYIRVMKEFYDSSAFINTTRCLVAFTA